jgi:hypothetical protein
MEVTIVSRVQVPLKTLIAWIRQRGFSAAADGDTMAIGATARDLRGQIMQVYGPHELQGPPSVDELADLWPAYRWGIEIALEADDRRDMVDLVRFLVAQVESVYQGVAFESGAGVVGRPVVGRLRAPRRERRIDLLELQFVFPIVAGPSIAGRLVALLGEVAPDLRPLRFGEGLGATRLGEGGDLGGFEVEWQRRLETEAITGANLSWVGRNQRFIGSLFQSPTGAPAPGTRPACLVAMTAELPRGVALADSPQADAFARLAVGLEPTYAEAEVEYDYLLTPRDPIADKQTRLTDHHFGPFFYGLPPTPPPLAWFGPSYVPLIPSEIVRHSMRAVGRGLLLMAQGDHSSIGGIVQPWVPAELTYRDPDPHTTLPADVIPQM